MSHPQFAANPVPGEVIGGSPTPMSLGVHQLAYKGTLFHTAHLTNNYRGQAEVEGVVERKQGSKLERAVQRLGSTAFGRIQSTINWNSVHNSLTHSG